MRSEVGFRRLVSFSDAVVAIAITLLILPLVDAASSIGTTGIGHFLSDNRTKLLAFLLSFVVIGRFWWGQHQVFERVKTYNPLLVWGMFVWLLSIVFLPFPTELISSAQDGNSGRHLRHLHRDRSCWRRSRCSSNCDGGALARAAERRAPRQFDHRRCRRPHRSHGSRTGHRRRRAGHRTLGPPAAPGLDTHSNGSWPEGDRPDSSSGRSQPCTARPGRRPRSPHYPDHRVPPRVRLADRVGVSTGRGGQPGRASRPAGPILTVLRPSGPGCSVVSTRSPVGRGWRSTIAGSSPASPIDRRRVDGT